MAFVPETKFYCETDEHFSARQRRAGVLLGLASRVVPIQVLLTMVAAYVSGSDSGIERALWALVIPGWVFVFILSVALLFAWVDW